MKILYTGIQYHFYRKEDGFSFEHANFYPALQRFPGANVTYVPFDRILEVGKTKFNEELREKIMKETPDLFFVFMLSDEIDKNLLTWLREKTRTKSIAWLSDDHWRFHNYSRYWAPYFDWVITTYSKAVEWYRGIGYDQVIRSQWGVDTVTFKPSTYKRDTDVSFVGTWNRARNRIIRTLEKNGISVQVFGSGWGTSRLDTTAMVDLFSRTKVNLGINEPSVDYSFKSLGKLFFRRSVNRIVPDILHVPQNVSSWLQGKRIPQIKARIFEIPACGSFLITRQADDLETYYNLSKEIVVYEGPEDLIRKVRFYVSHDAEREAIAAAGYACTIRDHQWESRLREIFRTIGLL